MRHATTGALPKDRKILLGCACWLADADAISALAVTPEGDTNIDIKQDYYDPCLRVLAPIMGARGRPEHLYNGQESPAKSATVLHVVAASSLVNTDPSAREASVRALVSLGADVNAVEEGVMNDSGKTPLRIAVSYLDVATTRALLECKADPNVKKNTVSQGSYLWVVRGLRWIFLQIFTSLARTNIGDGGWG